MPQRGCLNLFREYNGSDGPANAVNREDRKVANARWAKKGESTAMRPVLLVRFRQARDGRGFYATDDPKPVSYWRFEGDDFIILDDEGKEIERAGRDNHWCIFPVLCDCYSTMEPIKPLELARNRYDPRPTLLVRCPSCEIETTVRAERSTLAGERK